MSRGQKLGEIAPDPGGGRGGGSRANGARSYTPLPTAPNVPVESFRGKDRAGRSSASISAQRYLGTIFELFSGVSLSETESTSKAPYCTDYLLFRKKKIERAT